MPDAQCAANANGCRKDEADMNNKITILYERLSKDDELQGPSNSIKNQRALLEEYAERNGLVPYRHIQDDGWSGTVWDRPGWQEVLSLVEAGEVACICIKDLSRMSRDYLRAGLDREFFQSKDVRLIAVNDGYDSLHNDDDFTPFKEIMAEWYARDTSRKIRSVYQSKGNSGKRTSSHALYGYKKSECDGQQWEIDEPAAEVVRRIFAMTIEGMGVYQIAAQLQAERVECPSYYLAQNGCGNRKNKDFADPYRWWGTTVTYLLQREEYMGHTVNFKTTQKSFKNKRRYANEPENRKIFEDTQEAIISKDTWELANRLRANAKRYRNSLGKDRTHRLCRRGGLVEKLLPGLTVITDGQFETFVEKILLSGEAEKALDELVASSPVKTQISTDAMGDESVQKSENAKESQQNGGSNAAGAVNTAEQVKTEHRGAPAGAVNNGKGGGSGNPTPDATPANTQRNNGANINRNGGNAGRHTQ